MLITNVTGNYFLKQNDTATEIRLAVSEVDGTPVDLSLASRVEVVIGTLEGRMLVKTPKILPAIGTLEFGLDEGDRLPTGDNLVEVHIHDTEGEKRVAPSKGHYKLKVQQAIDELNAEVTTYTLDYFLSEVNRITYGLPDLIVRATELADQMDVILADSATLVADSTLALAQSQAAKEAAENALAASTEILDSASTNAARAETAAIAAEQVVTTTEQAVSAAIVTVTQATATAIDVTASTIQAKNAATLATTQANDARDDANIAATRAEGVATDLEGYNVAISDFALGTNYLKNQAVRFNGSTYKAKVETQGNPLPVAPATSNTWFDLIAQRGVDGQGAVASVNGIMPDTNGDVDLGNLAADWDSLTGKPTTFTPSTHSHAYVDITGKPTTFTPSAHVHPIAEITNLQNTIDQINSSIASIGQTGIPKLVSYQYVVPATTDGQTTVTIPLVTFDQSTDTLFLFRNTTVQSPNMYSVSGRTITLTMPVGTAADTVFHMMILKNVPIGPNGSINASVLLNGSVNEDKLDPQIILDFNAAIAKVETKVNLHFANSEVSPEDFTGNDYQKLQQAFDYVTTNRLPLKISKTYNIGNNTITINKESDVRYPTYISGGGKILKEVAGYMFNGSSHSTSDIVFNNIWFEGVEGIDVDVFDCGDASLIRINTNSCYFSKIRNVFYTPTYFQDIKMSKDTITKCSGSVFDFVGAFFITINGLTMENCSGGVVKHRRGTGAYTSIFNLVVNGSIIEGFSPQSVVPLFDLLSGSLTLHDNYFEVVNNGIVKFQEEITSLDVKNNTWLGETFGKPFVLTGTTALKVEISGNVSPLSPTVNASNLISGQVEVYKNISNLPNIDPNFKIFDRGIDVINNRVRKQGDNFYSVVLDKNISSVVASDILTLSPSIYSGGTVTVRGGGLQGNSGSFGILKVFRFTRYEGNTVITLGQNDSWGDALEQGNNVSLRPSGTSMILSVKGGFESVATTYNLHIEVSGKMISVVPQ